MPHQLITFFHRAANKKPTKTKPLGSHAAGIHIKHIIRHLLKYQTDLTDKQKLIVRASLPPSMTLPRKYDIFDILDAIFYMTKTGCQWSMLPNDHPSWRAVYHHFRSWSGRSVFNDILKELVLGTRAGKGETPEPEVAVIDRRSVRSGLPHSGKGVDGNKRIKGIEEHLATDNDGYPLTLHVTTANVHDSKGACPLMANMISDWTHISIAKADKGYAGPLSLALSESSPISSECVKSSFGTPEFIPIDGRWVVERTFAWLENYRRVCRNYEKLLKVARHMAIPACVCIMLKYFR